MINKDALITGSGGLIGSSAARFFASRGYRIIGIDNDMRRYFFGSEASTAWNVRKLKHELGERYVHRNVDIRDAAALRRVFRTCTPAIVIHTAAQPSHDWAAREPLTDFSVNAVGTLNMLEACRACCPEATFIYTSTNKVYGDNPNLLPLVERRTRYELRSSHPFAKRGIDETMSLDRTTHSLFGVSKAAADLMVQEYGRYFGMPTGVFRGGCLTGPAHSGTQLHGFLAYLAKCVATGHPYTIFGYKGKQVRDNIHADDLVSMFWHFHKSPRPGEVYNAGGSRHSNISMLEAIDKFEQAFNKKARVAYLEQARTGDHIWYISDVSKFQRHYPRWKYEYDIDDIIQEIARHGRFES